MADREFGRFFLRPTTSRWVAAGPGLQWIRGLTVLVVSTSLAGALASR
jgi:hypothetical protein